MTIYVVESTKSVVFIIRFLRSVFSYTWNPKVNIFLLLVRVDTTKILLLMETSPLSSTPEDPTM